MTIITDGTGSGNQARITNDNRLAVDAISTEPILAAEADGDSYNINTGEITLTSDSASALLYFKNNETRDYVISAIAVGLGPSTGGASTDIPVIKLIRNPTTGTIIDNSTAVDINSNRNFGSQNTLTADVYKGAEGDTFTNGTDHVLIYQTANGRVFAGITEVLPKGSSMGITVTPQTSNTSMTCYAAIIGYLRKEV